MRTNLTDKSSLTVVGIRRRKRKMYIRAITVLAVSVGLEVLASKSVNAATISIDDLLDGPPVLSFINIPVGVPGIQNVVSGPESLTFTYDDLVVAGATRTRLVFLTDPDSTSLASDEFSWSVVQGQSVEHVSFTSDLNPSNIPIPNPCVFNPDFFQNSCQVIPETGDFQLVLSVPTTGTAYLVRSDVIPEPETTFLLGAGLLVIGLLRRRNCTWLARLGSAASALPERVGRLAARRLARGALIVGCIFASLSAYGQTCPTEDPAIANAKSQKLFLYFPTGDDATFPNYGTNVSPAKAFDVAALTSGIGTTADLIDTIRKVVVDDYCEFNVQVLTTTTNPAHYAEPAAPPRNSRSRLR